MELYLVTYDIPSNKRRRRLASILEDYGLRVQKSVFEIWIDEADKRRLLKRLKKLIKPQEDSVRLYRLCELCQRKIQVEGLGILPQVPRTIII